MSVGENLNFDMARVWQVALDVDAAVAEEFLALARGTVESLFEFVGYQDTTWNELMAAALTGVLPVMLVFLFLQKYLVAGLTAGAVKE